MKKMNRKDFEQMLKEAGYSDIAIKYFLDRVNMGKVKNPTIENSKMGMCGDILTFSLKIEDNIIKDIKFQATCCVGGIAAAAAISELAKNKSLKEALKITEEDIARHLKKFPKYKIHCVCLAVKALKKTIENYERTGPKDMSHKIDSKCQINPTLT